MSQFDVDTQLIMIGSSRRLKNQVVIHPNNRLKLEDIAGVIIDNQIIHENADVCFVFFWDRKQDVGNSVARSVAFWSRDGVDIRKPVGGFLSTTTEAYKGGTLIIATNREGPG
jgi:hypothetical protein